MTDPQTPRPLPPRCPECHAPLAQVECTPSHATLLVCDACGWEATPASEWERARQHAMRARWSPGGRHE
jgi:hypothetical protein